MRIILIIVCLLTLRTLTSAQTIAPTQTDVITIDNATPGQADPNDRIRYTVTIPNTGGAPATLVQLNAVLDSRTTLVAGTFKTSPLAINDTYTVTGNVGITVNAAAGMRANDYDDNIPLLTQAAGTFATTGLGSITVAADGSFTYTPAAGFTGSDTYTYTLTDGDPVGLPVPLTDMGTVTFTVSNMIWFIDNTAGGTGGTGTLANPFRTIGDFNGSAGPLAGHLIFLKNTGTNYTQGINLKDNQYLYGTGHTGGSTLADVLPFTLAPNSPALPAINGTRPIITNGSGVGVSMAMNNRLRGFDVGACSGFGMDNQGTNSIGNLILSEVGVNNTTGGGFDASNGSGATMNAVFSIITSSGGVNGIDLTSCLGTFTVNGGTITNPTGTGVLISGGSVIFASSGVVTDNSGFAVDVDNHDSNNVTFSGNITSTGTGIRVQNCNGGTILFSGSSISLTTTSNKAVTLLSNAGATINITSGALVISTTSGNGYDATAGGTISVTGANNTITSTTGSPLNVANTTISNSNLVFKSISCNGAANGIVLNTTGASGGLSVTGTGTTNGSGGTIQNITNRGVSAIASNNLTLKNITFTNANGVDGPGPCGAADNGGCNAAIHVDGGTTVVLDNVDISGTTAEEGINLKNVTTFSLAGSTLVNCGIASSGSDTEESCLYALNLGGTCSINTSSLTLPSERAAVIYNTNKTMALTVNGSTFGNNQASALGADGLEIDSYGTSNSTIDIIGSTFTTPKTNGLQVIGENNAFISLDISNSTFDPGAGLAAAMDLDVKDAAFMQFNVQNNPLVKSAGINCINVFAFPDATFEGRINNNTVVVAPGSGTGIRVNKQGNNNCKVEIKNNNISGISADFGIDVQATLGTGRIDAIITGNTIALTNAAAYHIDVLAGASSSAFTNKICAYIANNITTTGVPIGNARYRAATATHELLIQGPGPNSATNWNSNTNTPISPPAVVNQSGVGVFTFNQTCLIPGNPPLSP